MIDVYDVQAERAPANTSASTAVWAVGIEPSVTCRMPVRSLRRISSTMKAF